MSVRQSIVLFFLACLPIFGTCQPSPSGITIVPRPVSVTAREGRFVLNSETRFYFPAESPDWEMAAQYLMGMLQTSTGFRFAAHPLKRKLTLPRENAVHFVFDEAITQPEAYKLEINPDHIVVRAGTAAGAFYAVQSLRQLFPPEVNSLEMRPHGILWAAPCCIIEDYPRFQYRGMHLDVGRHFFKVDFIKRYIDLLAAHKLNTFHWHLTDDQGWRIEIPKYPKLQTIAACRNETLVGHYSDEPRKLDGKKYCGYYTQEEVKEVLEHARRRFVTVVPEIELPGHAQAALSAYPELGCTGGPYEAATGWGVFYEVFCAGNEKTFEFLDNVLAEVCALFPGQYVHVGGDECPKERWKSCPKCQQRIRENGLKDEHELQSYVIKRAEQMLAKHGKKLIGWDEILEGGLAPSATVMSWRGTEGGIAAAKARHDVVMTPTDYCYFDYYQSEPTTEPLAIGGFLTIESVYNYEPVPTELTPDEARHILGTQANLWTEYIPTSEQAEYMAWPRACALAEVAWTSRDLKDWKDFSRRMRKHFARLDALKVNYSKAFFDITATFEHGKVSLVCNDPEQPIRYTTDGSAPTAKSTPYTGPFALPKSATVRAAAFQNEQKQGKTMSVEYLVHKASGRPYTLSNPPTKYTGGETFGLTNGVTGNLKRWNAWVALNGHDLDPAIDLGATMPLRRVTTHFVNGKDSWIYPPRSVEVLVSADGQAFKSVARREIEAEKMSGYSIETVALDLPPGTSARFVKLVAVHFGPIPAAAPGGGNPAWVFLDEVIVE